MVMFKVVARLQIGTRDTTRIGIVHMVLQLLLVTATIVQLVSVFDIFY